jgi:transposase
MRRIRDVLRLKASGMSKRQIAASVGIGPTAAGDYLRRAKLAGLVWPVPETLDDVTLEARLFPTPQAIEADQRRSCPRRWCSWLVMFRDR